MLNTSRKLSRASFLHTATCSGFTFFVLIITALTGTMLEQIRHSKAHNAKKERRSNITYNNITTDGGRNPGQVFNKSNIMKTKVIFRKEESGVIAIFPYIIGSRAQKTVLCYSHNEGHSSCDYMGVIRASKPAGEIEANDLFKELVFAVGYDNLQIMKKANLIKVYGQFYK